MKRSCVKARILMAFTDVRETLTKNEVLARANTRDFNELRHLVDADRLEKYWAPNRENRYRLTPSGVEMKAKL